MFRVLSWSIAYLKLGMHLCSALSEFCVRVIAGVWLEACWTFGFGLVVGVSNLSFVGVW